MVTFGSEQSNDEFTEIIISIDKFEDEEDETSLTGKIIIFGRITSFEKYRNLIYPNRLKIR
jgi:hypothetical protein